MEITYEAIFIIAIISILSVVLMLITFGSYFKYKNRKLLFVGFVFLFLFMRGILLTLSLFYEHIAALTASEYIWLFDVIILVLLYAAYSLKS